jgi:hypothetical protein
MRRDLILEGTREGEVKALSRIADGDGYWPDTQLRMALLSKGWLEQFGSTLVLTISGRTLLNAQTARHRSISSGNAVRHATESRQPSGADRRHAATPHAASRHGADAADSATI